MKRWLSRLIYKAVGFVNSIKTNELEVRLAETPADFEALWRLNYQTYVIELRQEKVSPEVAESGMLPDLLKDNTVYIITLDKGQLVGMLALTLPHGPFSIESSLTDSSVLDGIRDKTFEYRRLAVVKAYRHKGVLLRMGDFSLKWGLGQGYRHGIISALDRQIPTYARMGFRKIDRPFTKGDCTYQPMICNMDLFLSPEIAKKKFPLAMDAVKKTDL